MPSHEIPAALQEFISHRQHLKNKESSPVVKKKLGISDHKGKAELEQGIQGIMEFFRERVKELTATKMK
jgi:hypothetical protein